MSLISLITTFRTPTRRSLRRSGYLVMKKPARSFRKESRPALATCSLRSRSFGGRSGHRSPEAVLRRSRSEPRKEHCPEAQGHNFKLDNLRRLHIAYAQTGSLHVYNRATKFHSSTSQSHANYLHEAIMAEAIQKDKHAVEFVTDNGPD